jgi:hypothetical protein
MEVREYKLLNLTLNLAAKESILAGSIAAPSMIGIHSIVIAVSDLSHRYSLIVFISCQLVSKMSMPGIHVPLLYCWNFGSPPLPTAVRSRVSWYRRSRRFECTPDIFADFKIFMHTVSRSV